MSSHSINPSDFDAIEDFQIRRKKLWHESFVASVKTGAPVTHCVGFADDTLDAFDKRFGFTDPVTKKTSMRFFTLTSKLRAAQHLSLGKTVELFHTNVNDIMDKLEEQEGLINEAKRLLIEAHEVRELTTEVEGGSELGLWLEGVDEL